MTDQEVKRFYASREWKLVREQVMALDHHECQLCKRRGVYTPAQTVHHVKHLKDRPDLRLSVWDGDERQLVSLCNDCHNRVHPEKAYKLPAKRKPLTPERW